MENQKTSRLLKLLGPIDRFFNWAYGSNYNPLYRSGTLAMGLLLIVTITGLYLLIFYRLSAPFESMVEIQGQWWAGRWIRALHRYASDATVLALIFHFVRMLAEGKTWGPRTLAWVSGVLMTGIMFFSAWTGFVMVWDRSGQILAVTGAKILDLFPIFPEPLSLAFSGAMPLGSSFFFMNLFLHVALPLGMVFALWIHTSKLARSIWLPHRAVLWGTTIALTVLAIFWPAPLANPPDILTVGGFEPVDWFYNFWLPVSWYWGEKMSLLLWTFVLLITISMPWWLRPKKGSEPGKSIHDQEACTGCKQCSIDCPFEAIEMVNRTIGKGSEIVARVNDKLCTACGICAGSCSQFAIGPDGVSGRAQLERVKTLKLNYPKEYTVVIACEKSLRGKLEDQSVLFSVECAGVLHAGTVTALGMHYAGVKIVTCPPMACQNREGVTILHERLEGVREPSLPARIDRSKIQISVGSEPSVRGMWTKRLSLTAVILILIGVFSRIPAGIIEQNGFLRLTWHLPSQAKEKCRERTPEELAKLPFHMRVPKECTTVQLEYRLTVTENDHLIFEKTVVGKGVRGDRPLSVDELIPLFPGSHEFNIKFEPQENLESQATSLKYSLQTEFVAGRVVLVGYDAYEQKMYHRK